MRRHFLGSIRYFAEGMLKQDGHRSMTGKLRPSLWITLCLFSTLAVQCTLGEVVLTGIQKRWHPITLTFSGPATDEYREPNPFRTYRLNVIFTHAATKKNITIPGYFAADGNASETSAQYGNKWRVNFTPSEIGEWHTRASFRTGQDVAMSLEPFAGEPTSFDGETAEFVVTETDKTGRDHRRKGMLQYKNRRYLQFENGNFFLKGGADSPENLLGYNEFDATYSMVGGELKHFTPHLQDWKEGDPSWQNGKGKGMIGALNYLASTGANAFSFLLLNVEGDGKDVWPWPDPYSRDRYDVSKLEQWNLVFSHADKLGLFMHMKMQETENDLLLNNGDLGPERKLYYRELIARFGHHHALNWNLGEEHDIWEERQDWEQNLVKSYVRYINALDAYKHPVVAHAYPVQHTQAFTPLLGWKSNLTGVSLQSNWYDVHAMTLRWVNESTSSGRPWVVTNDEQNKAEIGVAPDSQDENGENRALVRQQVLWGNLMAGGGGVEYYFGYNNVHSDLNSNNWRERESKWSDVSHALNFFSEHVPYWDMNPSNELALKWGMYCLAKPGNTILYYWYRYLEEQPRIRIPFGTYVSYFYNPREGGGLILNNPPFLKGPVDMDVTAPDNEDWVLILKAVPDSGS